MRIVYMLTSLRVGGAERQVVALAERMAARGHSVTIVALRAPAAAECAAAVPVVYLNLRKTPASFVAALLRAHRFLRRFRPDVLHSHMFHANIFARVLAMTRPGYCVVSTVHNVYEGGWLRMLLYRATDGLSRCTAFVSQAAADRYQRLHAVSQRKCKVMTNGIDSCEFASDDVRRSQVRAEFKAGDRFLWLAAGRIVPAKDYLNLLRAFAWVRLRRPDAWLLIAGERWGDEFNRLVELCAQLSLGDAVLWLGLRRDMPALFDAADGFVLSSAWEGLPLVLAEAMAMEKPVVATDVGGVRELVGDAGNLVPSGRPEALAAAMLRTMETSLELRGQVCRAARARIATYFDVNAKAGEWERLYRMLLGYPARVARVIP